MPGEPDETHRIGGRNRVHRSDAEIAALAGRQHGVASYRQLRALGLSARAIEGRVAAGHLHRVHRGVYAIGHPSLSLRGHWMAAVLAGGAGAALSHRPAGAGWTLRAWTGRPAVTVPSWRRSTDRIDFHCSILPPDETTTLDGIPITTIPRTLLDLATVLDHDALVRALNEAEARRLADPLPLTALVDRHQGERGTARLREALASTAVGRGVTVGALEERFARFLAAHSFPPPLLNAAVDADGRNYVADCLWPKQRVIVELQSFAFHGTAAAMTRDAERTRHLTLAGFMVVYVTWAQLHDRSAAATLATDLNRLLRPGRR